jgi:transposase-like protein
MSVYVHHPEIKVAYRSAADRQDPILIYGLDMSKKVPCCPQCKSVDFKHTHDSAHGIHGAHMAGSERYECNHCNYRVFKNEGEKLGFNFVLD